MSKSNADTVCPECGSTEVVTLHAARRHVCLLCTWSVRYAADPSDVSAEDGGEGE